MPGNRCPDHKNTKKVYTASDGVATWRNAYKFEPPFFCMNEDCGVELKYLHKYTRPTSKQEVRQHFRYIPDSTRTYEGRILSDAETFTKAIESALSSSRTFDMVKSGLRYHADIKDNGRWKEKRWNKGKRRSFAIGVYAMRTGKPGVYSVIHVVDLKNTTGKDVGRLMKELAGEPSWSQKRRFLSINGETFNLPEHVHQTVVLLENDFSLPEYIGRNDEGEDEYKFKPTVGEFFPFFIESVNFIDRNDTSLKLNYVTKKREVDDSHEDDPSFIGTKKEEVLHEYTLYPEAGVHKRIEVENRSTHDSCIDIRKWKLVRIVPLESSDITMQLQMNLFS